MKKILISILCFIMLCGCSKTQLAQGDVDEYKTYYNTVIENVTFNQTSLYFDVSSEMVQVEDGTYRYYIVIDNPKLAMYNIVTIAVENDTPYEQADGMMPSMGIFDDSKSMIPYQVNSENGFVKGIALSGDSEQSSINIKLLVQWTDSSKKNTKREYLSFVIQPTE